jgi:lipopolysaccharide biosynthesis glycosyltransferase
MRQEDILDQSLKYILSGNHHSFQDQNILNLIYEKRLDLLPHDCNIPSLNAPDEDVVGAAQDPVAVDFLGLNKPWDI